MGVQLVQWYWALHREGSRALFSVVLLPSWNSLSFLCTRRPAFSSFTAPHKLCSQSWPRPWCEQRIKTVYLVWRTSQLVMGKTHLNANYIMSIKCFLYSSWELTLIFFAAIMKLKDTCFGDKSLLVRKAEQNSTQLFEMGHYQHQRLWEKKSHCDWEEVKQGTSRQII